MKRPRLTYFIDSNKTMHTYIGINTKHVTISDVKSDKQAKELCAELEDELWETYINSKTVKYERKPLPEKLFLNDVEYHGECGYINGYNGYERTTEDGLLCAVINHSLFTKGEPNLLTDKYGYLIENTNLRGNIIKV